MFLLSSLIRSFPECSAQIENIMMHLDSDHLLTWLVTGLLTVIIPVIVYKVSDVSKRKVCVILYYMAFIFISRFLVMKYGIWQEPFMLSDIELLFNSLVHTLQTFSMDESYTDFVTAGTSALSECGFHYLAKVYGISSSFVNMLAPIMGGALLFDVLTDIFPGVSLMFRPFRRKFVFSELNEGSICLAEDLFAKNGNTRNYKKVLGTKFFTPRPVIVFADVEPTEDSDEKHRNTPELIDRAKSLKAICIKKSIMSCDLKRSRSVHYILADRNSRNNLDVLSEMLMKENICRLPRKGRNAKIFVFTESTSESSLVVSIAEKYITKGETVVRPIMANQNAAVNLMYDVPLFMPLIKRTPRKHTVTPWRRPEVHPLAENTWHRMQVYISSGIKKILRKTADVLIFVFTLPVKFIISIGRRLSLRENSEKVRKLFAAETPAVQNDKPLDKSVPEHLYITIFGSGHVAEESLKAVFWCGQMTNVLLHISVISQDENVLKKRIADFFPDMAESRFSNTKLLRIYPDDPDSPSNPPYLEELSFHHCDDLVSPNNIPDLLLERTNYYIINLGSDKVNIEASMNLRRELCLRSLSGSCPRQPFIVPAVFDQHLASSVTYIDPYEDEPYVVPYSSFREQFSCKNVFMSNFTEAALSSAGMYGNEDHNRNNTDEYSSWANIARTIHAPYKLWSIGLLKDVDLHKAPGEGRFEILHNEAHIRSNRVQLAYLEHRRWVAFQRAQGFTSPTPEQLEKILHMTGSHKSVKLKLHPCVAESDAVIRELPLTRDFDRKHYDSLDILAHDIGFIKIPDASPEDMKAYYASCSFKQWDVYEQDDAFIRLSGLKEADLSIPQKISRLTAELREFIGYYSHKKRSSKPQKQKSPPAAKSSGASVKKNKEVSAAKNRKSKGK